MIVTPEPYRKGAAFWCTRGLYFPSLLSGRWQLIKLIIATITTAGTVTSAACVSKGRGTDCHWKGISAKSIAYQWGQKVASGIAGSLWAFVSFLWPVSDFQRWYPSVGAVPLDKVGGVGGQRKEGMTADPWSSRGDEHSLSCSYNLIFFTTVPWFWIFGIERSFSGTLIISILALEPRFAFLGAVGPGGAVWHQVQSYLPYIFTVYLWANRFPPVNLFPPLLSWGHSNSSLPLWSGTSLHLCRWSKASFLWTRGGPGCSLLWIALRILLWSFSFLESFWCRSLLPVLTFYILSHKCRVLLLKTSIFDGKKDLSAIEVLLPFVTTCLTSK